MKLSEAVKLLSECGIDDPRFEARELFIHVGGMDRAALLSPDCECESEQLSAAVKRRAAHEPLQYIIGEVGFYRETYEVSPDCLIPRSDTEILVDFAVKNIPEGKSFLDLCTGSGCIAVSTLKNTKNTTAIAVDISESALRIARKNAERNGVSERVVFLEADARKTAVEGEFFALLSNPPYVTEDEYEKLAPELYFEPRLALVGEDFGLEFYKAITSLYRDRIDPCGFIAFEIGASQGDALREIARAHGMSCEIIKDLSSLYRVAILRKV